MSESAPVDVGRIVQGIRDEIDRRRAQGDLTAEDIEWLLERRLTSSLAKARIDDRIASRMLQESHDWNTDTGYQIRTDRPGFPGVLIKSVKHVIRPFVRLYTDHILKRQSQLNLAMWHVLLDSVEKSVSLEMEIRRLQKDVQDLKDRA